MKATVVVGTSWGDTHRRHMEGASEFALIVKRRELMFAIHYAHDTSHPEFRAMADNLKWEDIR